MSVKQLRMPPVLIIVSAFLCSILVACESHKSGETAQSHTSSATSSTAQRSQHEVVIREMKYQPADLSVHVGDTVVWKNNDIFPHTVSAADQSIDSGTIQPGATWTYVARTSGVHPYTCKPHPNMKARLVVQ